MQEHIARLLQNLGAPPRMKTRSFLYKLKGEGKPGVAEEINATIGRWVMPTSGHNVDQKESRDINIARIPLTLPFKFKFE